MPNLQYRHGDKPGDVWTTVTEVCVVKDCSACRVSRLTKDLWKERKKR